MLEMAYQSTCVTKLLELAEERRFEFAMAMVVCLERLEYFVEALEEEGPEIMQWPKVADTFRDMCRVVMVGLYNAWSIELSFGVSMSEN
jgi:hypothetical protein